MLQYVAFCHWLLLLNIMVSRFIYLVACVKTSFLLMDKNSPFMNIYHIMFIHSSFNGHLSRFSFLAIMDNAGINICFVPNALLTEQSGFSLPLYYPVCLLINLNVIFYKVKS